MPCTIHVRSSSLWQMRKMKFGAPGNFSDEPLPSCSFKCLALVLCLGDGTTWRSGHQMTALLLRPLGIQGEDPDSFVPFLPLSLSAYTHHGLSCCLVAFCVWVNQRLVALVTFCAMQATAAACTNAAESRGAGQFTARTSGSDGGGSAVCEQEAGEHGIQISHALNYVYKDMG